MNNNGKRIGSTIVTILLIIAVVGGLFVLNKIDNKPIERKEEACNHQYAEGFCTKCGAADANYVRPDEIVNISMVCGGDIMYHLSQLKSAYNYDGDYSVDNDRQDITINSGTFDFDRPYQYIKEYIESADIAFANLETTLAGGPYYSGYQTRFNAPDELATSLKNVGFDVIFTSNNHSLDKRLDGLKRTVEVLRAAGLETVGSRTDVTEKKSLITTVKGVKIGVVSYTYETATSEEGRTLNGAARGDEAFDYLNTFRYGDDRLALEEDKAEIQSEISWCKSKGADIVVCYLHWDAFNEYKLTVDSLQKDLAQFVAESGADIIFASHPHRVQTIEELVVTVDGKDKTVPVYYSLGNFISNQRYESLTPYGDPEAQARATEEELLAYIELSYNKTKKELTINTVKAIPLWVDRYKVEGLFEYRIIPLLQGFDTNEDLVYSGHVTRATDALSNITNIIGEEYIYQ